MTVKALVRATTHRRHVLGVAATALTAAVVLSACSSSSKQGSSNPPGSGATGQSGTTTGAAAPTTSASTSAKPIPTKPVHMSALESDGTTWGVGMPIVLWFNVAPKTSADFVKQTTVTVNGASAAGAWYWEASAHPGAKIEAHYRPDTFWPAHAQIKVTFPPAGTSAGPGLAFDGKLSSLSIATGDARIGTVDGSSKLTVTDNGKPWGTFPLALGAANTPTLNGTKVIMYKGRNERMIGSGYDEIVPFSMRLTNSGEYLHAASWNVGNIKSGTPSSNGCSNMLPADAAKLFGFMQVGDPVIYSGVPDAKSTMPSWDGYGDWNVSWSTWKQGGQLLNH